MKSPVSNKYPDGQIPEEVGPIYFVQWLRVILIVLVVAHHAGQAYGPTGGEWPVDDPAKSPWLGLFFMFNAAFFMGFFFLISGYFVRASYDRKGATRFLQERLVRLGLPLIFVTVFIFGSISFLDSTSQLSYFNFLLFQYLGQWQIEMGPLWFLAQLLALCILYTLYRALTASNTAASYRVLAVPNNQMIVIYTILLGFCGMGLRGFYQQDYWVSILGIIPIEIVHLPQYLSLFLIGIVAGQGRWFEKLSGNLGLKWFVTALVAFTLAVAVRPFVTSLPADVMPFSLTSNAVWNILWGFLEAFVCVGLIIGLLIFSRKHFSRASSWLEQLDKNVFGIYIIHVFILVGIQQVLVDFALPALVKFSIAGISGLLLSYLNVVLLRQIPWLRRVI